MKRFNINNYIGKYVMYCKTEEEAREFCNYLHNIGMRWCSGSPYICHTNYSRNHNNVYYFNDGTHGSLNYAINDGYTVLEFSDFDWSKEFTKADLKTGDVALQRDGTVQIVNRELGMFITEDWWNDMANFDSDLTHNMDEDFDIIAVRRPLEKGDCTFRAFKFESGTLVYERKEVEEMTLAEVCKLLGKNIKIIQ